MKGWGAIRRPLYRALQNNALWLHQYWPGKVRRPVFIVGCPRSGTSVFGRIFEQAPEFLYLHEPRHIWCQVNPKLDVWAYENPISQGMLFWDASHATIKDTDRLSQWFALELFVSLRSRLIEKMPLNVFRLLWLNALFPDATFIHLIRNGRDVSLSLKAAVKNWFPPGYWENSRHYGIFEEYASQSPELNQALLHLTEDTDNYARGLLVWLCSVTAGRHAGRQLGPEKYGSSPNSVLTGKAQFS